MATNTEMMIHDQMTPVTAFSHSAQEIDNAVDKANNALARDGSNAMTGALELSGGGYDNQLHIKRTVSQGDTVIRFSGLLDGSFALFGRLGFNTLGKPFVRLATDSDSVYNELLHTSNKPSGSYTGNGSATTRTIDIGGVGPILLIYTSNNIAIVSVHGAFIIRSTGAVHYLSNSECKFSNGVLTLATTDPSVNGPYTYYYQVL